MAFCSSCGAELPDGMRFCERCGADQTVRAERAPATAPVPVATMPPPASGKGHGLVWLLVIGAGIGTVYYYHQTHQQTPPQPSQQPGNQPGAAPTGQPGPQSQPGPEGQPGQQPVDPGPEAQPGEPGPQAQPGGQGQGGNGETLVQLQKFSGNLITENGYFVETQAVWTNDSNVTVARATLGCGEFAPELVKGSAKYFTVGPLGPGQSKNFNPFQIGPARPGAKAGCGFMGATAAAR